MGRKRDRKGEQGEGEREGSGGDSGGEEGQEGGERGRKRGRDSGGRRDRKGQHQVPSRNMTQRHRIFESPRPYTVRVDVVFVP